MAGVAQEEAAFAECGVDVKTSSNRVGEKAKDALHVEKGIHEMNFGLQSLAFFAVGQGAALEKRGSVRTDSALLPRSRHKQVGDASAQGPNT